LRLSAELIEGFSKAIKEYMDDYINLCQAIFEHTFRILGDDSDPYREIKDKSMKAAETLAPLAEEYITHGDFLERAVKVAIVANALDFGTRVYKISLEKFCSEFQGMLNRSLAINHVSMLKADLENAKRVLYVLDNAGECDLDRFLLQALSNKREVTIATRGGPVLNGVTLKEAVEAGLDRYGELITTGAALPCISRSSDTYFLEKLRNADIAILKGKVIINLSILLMRYAVNPHTISLYLSVCPLPGS